MDGLKFVGGIVVAALHAIVVAALIAIVVAIGVRLFAPFLFDEHSVVLAVSVWSVALVIGVVYAVGRYRRTH